MARCHLWQWCCEWAQFAQQWFIWYIGQMNIRALLTRITQPQRWWHQGTYVLVMWAILDTTVCLSYATTPCVHFYLKLPTFISICWQGTIPTEIGLLAGLTFLRLNFNSFAGSYSSWNQESHKTVLLHLQSNRIEGPLVLTNLQQGDYGKSSFITDCCSPSIMERVICIGCSICCKMFV